MLNNIVKVLLLVQCVVGLNLNLKQLERLNIEISEDLPPHLCNQTLQNIEVNKSPAK